MEMIFAIGVWIAFATVTAIAARWFAVKWAEKRGWSALTMPMVYHVFLIVSYLVLVQVAWVILYATIIR